MKHRRILGSVTWLISTALFCGLSFVATAATTVVHVKLEDPSSDPPTPAMHIEMDRDTVPAGKVSFRAVNLSKNQVHEMIVVRTDGGHATLPYDEGKSQVVEKRIRHLGEIPELKPGASAAMTIALKPGSYVLICNQPGHYKAGMTASLTVTR